MTQKTKRSKKTQAELRDIPGLLAGVAVDGLSDVAVAVEPGAVDAGVSRLVATDPLLIMVLSGRAGYHIRQGGARVRLERRAGEALVLWGGATVSVSPRHPNVSLGVGLLATQTNADVMRPPGPGDPARAALETSPWTREARAADDVPYSHSEKLARLASPVGVPTALRLSLQALTCDPQRPSDDPWRRTTLAAVLLDVARLLAAPPPPAATKARRSFDRLCAEIDRDFDQALDRQTLAVY
jgi:hypothetical protein